MRKFFTLLTIAVILVGCSAAYKSVECGSELQKMGNHYCAALKYVEALQYEPTHKKAKIKLCEVSKLAYDQKLSLAESAENSSNYEQALREYTDLKEFLSNVNYHNCVSFPTINTSTKISEMKSSASEKYYKKAEEFFKNESYQSSIYQYEQALNHNNPYKDSTTKISESYYKLASIALKDNSFRKAAKYFISANGRINDYKDASQYALEIYYALGKYFLSIKECRKAWHDFMEAKKIDPQYKDLSNLMNLANECSVTKIAFMHFENKTGRDIAGMAVGDFIFDELKTKIQRNASRFIELLDREDVHFLLSEQKMGMDGITDNYATFNQIKGVDYLIFGKITQVRHVRQGLRSVEKRTQGEEAYRCMKTGRKGKTYEGWCYRKVPVRYELYSDKISVSLAGSVKVLSVSTGQAEVQYSINEKEEDKIKYVDNILCRSDPDNTKIDDEINRLAKERQEILDEDTLGKKIISNITDAMAQRVLSKIDITPNVNDPISLNLSLTVAGHSQSSNQRKR